MNVECVCPWEVSCDYVYSWDGFVTFLTKCRWAQGPLMYCRGGNGLENGETYVTLTTNVPISILTPHWGLKWEMEVKMQLSLYMRQTL